MKVRAEIEKYSLPEEKEMMLWLFERNHWESQWRNIAYCVFVRYGDQSYQAYRCWRPQPAGRTLYHTTRLMDTLAFYANKDNWQKVDTGIGEMEGPAYDYGAKAREALEIVQAKPAPDPTSNWVYDKELRRYIQKT